MKRFLALPALVALFTSAAAAQTPHLVEFPTGTARDHPARQSQLLSQPEWPARRAAILNAMQEVMGPLPGSELRSPLDIRVEEETDAGTHVRQFITYQSEPGHRVPAYLLIPKQLREKSTSMAPAVLCLHPTNQELGHKVIVGFGGDGGQAYALELAERGFVTLAPAYPHLSTYTPDLGKLGYASGTMKAIWDNIRGADLLESLSFVSPKHFGVIGHSLGGHNAIFTAAFDERFKVVVSSCGFDSFKDYYSGDPAKWKPGNGWTQVRYMPRLAAYAGRLHEIPFDFDDLLSALAPRHVFISAPVGDANFQWRSVQRIATSARAVYQLHDADDHLQVVHPDCVHEFPEALRHRAYDLFEQHLR